MQRLFSLPLVVGVVSGAGAGLLVWGLTTRENATAADPPSPATSVVQADVAPVQPGKTQPGAQPMPPGAVPFEAFGPTRFEADKRRAIEKGLQTRFSGEIADGPV